MKKRLIFLVFMFVPFLVLLTACREEPNTPSEEPSTPSSEPSSSPSTPSSSSTETHKHNYVKGNTVDATCLEDGYTVYTCSCGLSENRDITTKLGHDYGAYVVTVEPTWENTGLKEKVCNRCNDKVSEVVPALKEGHVHSFNDFEVATAPTLTSEGLLTSNCEALDKSETVVLPALTSNLYTKTSNSIEATCTSDGRYEYEITLEKLGIEGEKTFTFYASVEKLNHDLVHSEKEATCTEEGYVKDVCKNCDYENVTIVSALGHTWTRDGHECEADKVCSVCHIVGEVKSNHKLIQTVTDATCTSEGLITYTCEYCNEVINTVTIQKLDHTYSDFVDSGRVETDSTNACISYKFYIAECSECHATIDKKETVYNHDFVAHVTLATCKSDGLIEYECSVCHLKTESKTIPMSDSAHDYVSQGIVDNVETYKCSYCEHTKTVLSYKNQTSATVSKDDLSTNQNIELEGGSISLSDDALASLPDNVNISITETSKDDLSLSDEIIKQIGDNTIYDFNLDDTDNNKVYFDGSVTVRIPYTLKEKETPNDIAIWYIDSEGNCETISATYVNGYVEFKTTHFSYYTVRRLTDTEKCKLFGHDYVLGSSLDATCTINGYKNYVCRYCGDVDHQVIKALGHKYHKEIKEATCTSSGYQIVTCDDCDYREETYISQKDHNFEIVSDTYVEVSCTHSGHIDYKCKDCGATYSVTTAKLNHNYEDTVVSPTCTSEGYTIHTCKDCGDTIRDSYKDALGHKYVEIIVSPTCTTEGYTLHKCRVCEDSYKTDVVNARHTWDIDEPTCGKGQTCTECGALGQAATGKHTYDENGICTVCKDGCNHEFTESHVDASCKNDGYDLKVCSICGYEEKTNIVKKYGHTGSVICETCGEAIISESQLNNFFNTLINNKTITFTCDKWEYNDNEIYENMYITLKLNNNNKLDGYMSFDYYNYSSNGWTRVMKPNIAIIKDDILYVKYGEYSTFDTSKLNLNYSNSWNKWDCYYTYTMGDIYEIFGLPNLDSILQMLDENKISKIYELVRKIYNSNDSTITSIKAKILNNLFTVTKNDYGYVISLNNNYIKDIYSYSLNHTISNTIDYLIKDGFYDGLLNFVEKLDQKTVGDVLDFIKKQGITLEELVSLLNELVPTEDGSNFEAILNQILGNLDNTLIGYLTSLAISNQNLFEFVKSNFDIDLVSYQEETLSTLNQIKDSNILDLFGISKDSDEFTSFDSCFMDILNSNRLTINTNNEFEMLSADVSLNGVINNGTIKADFNISFDGAIDYSDDVYYEVKALYNVDIASALKNSGYELIYNDNNELTGFIFETTDTSEKTIYTEELGGNLYKYVHYTKDTIRWRFNLDDLSLQDIESDCNNYYIFGVHSKELAENEGYSERVLEIYKNGVLIETNTENRDSYYSKSYVQLLYNSKTQQFEKYDGNNCTHHNYILVETKGSSSDCNTLTYRKYACTDCGYSYTRYAYYGHKGDYESETYEFLTDSKNCEHGVNVYLTCVKCKETYLNETRYEHQYEYIYRLHEGSTTCADGLDYVKVCKICGEEEVIKYYDKYGHDYYWDSEYFDKYGVDLSVSYKECSVCHEKYDYECDGIEDGIKIDYNYETGGTIIFANGDFIVEDSIEKTQEGCNIITTLNRKFIYDGATVYEYEDIRTTVAHTYKNISSEYTEDGYEVRVDKSICSICNHVDHETVTKYLDDVRVSEYFTYYDDNDKIFDTQECIYENGELKTYKEIKYNNNYAGTYNIYEDIYENGNRISSKSSSYFKGELEYVTLTQYEYTIIEDEQLVSKIIVTNYDSEGNVTGGREYISEYDVNNCIVYRNEYIDGELLDTNSYIHHFYHTEKEPTCTQVGIKRCNCEEEFYYIQPKGHSFKYSDEDNHYTCTECGTVVENRTWGIYVEELSSSCEIIELGYYMSSSDISLVEVYAEINGEDTLLSFVPFVNSVVKYENPVYSYSSGTIELHDLNKYLSEYDIEGSVNIKVNIYDYDNNLCTFNTTYTI